MCQPKASETISGRKDVVVENIEVDMSKIDDTQAKYLTEECILVDENDQVIGSDTKKNCHLQPLKLHRAFSVFLFNSEGKLLLQQRAKEKITFPECFTNTCCSHPLHRAEEMEAKDFIGAKRAGVRKLEHELGITPDQISTDDLTCLSRMYYKASSDETWGEHEITYILLAKKDVTVIPNPNEVMSYKYVDADELKELLAKGERGEIKFTPWFVLISKAFLFKWWGGLDKIDSFVDTENIYRM